MLSLFPTETQNLTPGVQLYRDNCNSGVLTGSVAHKNHTDLGVPDKLYPRQDHHVPGSHLLLLQTAWDISTGQPHTGTHVASNQQNGKSLFPVYATFACW